MIKIHKEITNTSSVAYYSVFLALMLIMSYVENQVSFLIPVYGVKLGLCNVVVLVALYTFGTNFALIINMVRIFLVGVLFGNAYGMIYSFAGGIVSFVLMYIAKRTNLFSKMGVSIIGALGHNVAQIVVATILLKNSLISLYLPVVLISAILTGGLIGIAGGIVCKKMHL